MEEKDVNSKRFLRSQEPEINKNLIVILVVSSLLLFGGIGYVLFFL